MGRIEGATSPHVQTCRLPQGLSSREHLTKRPKEEKQMTAAIPAGETSLDGDATGASFHGVTDWHAIDWQNVNHTVRRRAPRES
jgi:hypothetical protein